MGGQTPKTKISGTGKMWQNNLWRQFKNKFFFTIIYCGTGIFKSTSSCHQILIFIT